jgi:hypothetical protein
MARIKTKFGCQTPALPLIKGQRRQKILLLNWKCSSVVECLPSIHEALSGGGGKAGGQEWRRRRRKFYSQLFAVCKQWVTFVRLQAFFIYRACCPTHHMRTLPFV